MLEIEISGVLSSSSRTAFSKLCPFQRDLIPDFFFSVSRYSASSVAEVSSPITLFFRESRGDSFDILLALSTDPFHLCFFEAICAYYAPNCTKVSPKQKACVNGKIGKFENENRIIDRYIIGKSRVFSERGPNEDWDERPPSQNKKEMADS